MSTDPEEPKKPRAKRVPYSDAPLLAALSDFFVLQTDYNTKVAELFQSVLGKRKALKEKEGIMIPYTEYI